jgi:uncharacterized membrane protein
MLSDGVFAIAMTLLVLELELPESRHAGAAETLHEFWPTFGAYVASFAVLGVYWVGQNIELHHVRHADPVLWWLTLLFLMLIAAVPFSARLVGHLHFVRWAVLFYGAHLVCIGATQHVTWRYAERYLREPDVDASTVRALSRRSLAPIVVHAFALMLAFVSPYVSVAIYAFIPIVLIARAFMAAPRGRGRSARHAEAHQT